MVEEYEGGYTVRQFLLILFTMGSKVLWQEGIYLNFISICVFTVPASA